MRVLQATEHNKHPTTTKQRQPRSTINVEKRCRPSRRPVAKSGVVGGRIRGELGGEH